MKSRSCAIVNHEPCQDLTVAALRGPNDVPQGSFGRVLNKNYCFVSLNKIGLCFQNKN